VRVEQALDADAHAGVVVHNGYGFRSSRHRVPETRT
jgi:hypothetical protein